MVGGMKSKVIHSFTNGMKGHFLINDLFIVTRRPRIVIPFLKVVKVKPEIGLIPCSFNQLCQFDIHLCEDNIFILDICVKIAL